MHERIYVLKKNSKNVCGGEFSRSSTGHLSVYLQRDRVRICGDHVFRLRLRRRTYVSSEFYSSNHRLGNFDRPYPFWTFPVGRLDNSGFCSTRNLSRNFFWGSGRKPCIEPADTRHRISSFYEHTDDHIRFIIFFFSYVYFSLQNARGRGTEDEFCRGFRIGFFVFTLMSVLTVNLLNLYIKEKDELIKEIHHRVRNNLQVLCGLADLHKNDWSDSKKVLIKFQNRILAMSEVHNYLYKSDNYHKIEFSQIIERIVADMKNKNDDFKVNVLNHSERIELPIEIAIPCAMIFNELLNNSFMHAFKETKDPNIEILFSKTGENCNLTIKDNGTGIPLPIDMKKQKTTGFTLVHILSKQIRANIEFFNDNGLVAVLKF